MASRRNAPDNNLYDKLMQLKSHMTRCSQCKAAGRTSSPRDMCDVGILIVLRIAAFTDAIAGMRVKAARSGMPVCYPCPDLSRHGKPYALTAAPVIVAGTQNSLF